MGEDNGGRKFRFVPPGESDGPPASPGSVHGLGHEIINTIDTYMKSHRACTLGTIHLALAKVDAAIVNVVIENLSHRKPEDDAPQD